MIEIKSSEVVFISFGIAAIVLANKKHDDNVGYKFGYGVHDPDTHDIKSHHEERHGKYVTGYYKLKQPDGTTRIVHYKAGPHTGFKAFVEVVGHSHHDGHHSHGHQSHHHGHQSHGHHQEHEEKKDDHDGYEVHEDEDEGDKHQSLEEGENYEY